MTVSAVGTVEDKAVVAAWFHDGVCHTGAFTVAILTPLVRCAPIGFGPHEEWVEEQEHHCADAADSRAHPEGTDLVVRVADLEKHKVYFGEDRNINIDDPAPAVVAKGCGRTTVAAEKAREFAERKEAP